MECLVFPQRVAHTSYLHSNKAVRIQDFYQTLNQADFLSQRQTLVLKLGVCCLDSQNLLDKSCQVTVSFLFLSVRGSLILKSYIFLECKYLHESTFPLEFRQINYQSLAYFLDTAINCLIVFVNLKVKCINSLESLII